MRIHEDDRRFKCEHCGVAFVQKCSWRGHMRSKHDDSEASGVFVKVEIEFKEEKPEPHTQGHVKNIEASTKEINKDVKKKIPKIGSKTIVTKKKTELDLQVENLRAMMKCSNATPLRLHGKLYTCCFCPENFNDTAALKNHTLEKHSDCNNPILGRNLSKLIIRLDITGLLCSLCNMNFDSIEKLIEHLKDEHSQNLNTRVKNYMIPFKFEIGRELTCAICDQQFHNFKMLVQHMHGHYPNFTCDSCGSGFINQKSLQCHANRHANGEHKCETCQRIFDNHVKLRDHNKFAHRGFKQRNKCDHCEKRFICYTTKISHMIKKHGLPADQAKCSACDKTFKSQKSLTMHKRAYHMLEKKHKCPECDKTFFTTYLVKKHLITHTGQRDFKCLICNKSYGRKHTLREHMRIHADDRRFKCEHCGMAFVQKCSWRGHMRSKHGEEV